MQLPFLSTPNVHNTTGFMGCELTDKTTPSLGITPGRYPQHLGQGSDSRMGIKG